MASVKQQVTTAFAMKGNTISNAALAISHASWSWGSTDLNGAIKAIVAVNAQGIVLTYDGTDPTTTLGLPLASGSSVEIYGNVNIQNLKFIRSGGSDATVTVILEK